MSMGTKCFPATTSVGKRRTLVPKLRIIICRHLLLSSHHVMLSCHVVMSCCHVLSSCHVFMSWCHDTSSCHPKPTLVPIVTFRNCSVSCSCYILIRLSSFLGNQVLLFFLWFKAWPETMTMLHPSKESFEQFKIQDSVQLMLELGIIKRDRKNIFYIHLHQQ